MPRPSAVTGTIVALILAWGFPACAQAAEIKALADGPLAAPLRKIGAEFTRDTGHRMAFVFGPSPQIDKRIAGGETADVVVIQPRFIAELAKQGKVAPGMHPIIARVGVGIAVRASQPAPDVSTSAALRAALLSADTIIFNNVASGNRFAMVLDKLQLTAETKSKVVRVSPAETFKRVLQGKGKDLAVGTIPQILMTEGLKLAGPLPAEHASPIPYAIAVMKASSLGEEAAAFMTFVQSPKAKAILKAAGVD
jgi:molybdate transport system substrate-binding protein